MYIVYIFDYLLAYEERKWENEENRVVIKRIINSLNLSGQLQVFSRFFGTSFLPCHLYYIVLNKWISLFINTAGTWHLICITGSYLMDLFDEIRVLLLFNRSAFFLYCWILKSYLSFLFVKNVSSMQTEKMKEEGETKKKMSRQLKHIYIFIYILFYISEWIKNKPSLKCWFSTIEETIFLFFFDSVFMICYAWSNKVSQVWESAQLTAG